MNSLVLSAQTTRLVQRYLYHRTHALVLTGPEGIGKFALAEQLATEVIGLASVEALAHYPYYKVIAVEEGKQSISIESVRELQQFTKLKLPHNPANSSRVIIIKDADRMTPDAQNAVLNLLEEPPVDTVFILTSILIQHVLPTIRSRVQQIAITRPSRTDCLEYFTGRGFITNAIQQAFLLSGGLPGLMNALLEDVNHPLKSSVDTARTVLQASQFERLCMVENIVKKRDEVQHLIVMLQHMAQATLEQTAQKQQDSTAALRSLRQWLRVLRVSYEADIALTGNAQSKLVLTNLMLAL